MYFHLGFYISTIVLISSSIVSGNSLLDSLSNILAPDLQSCKRDRDCHKIAAEGAPKNLTTKEKILKVIVGRIEKHLNNGTMIQPPQDFRCYQRKFCVPSGSDLGLNRIPNYRTSRRALYTIQFSNALLQKEFNKTLTKEGENYCDTIELKYEYRDPTGLSFAVYQEQSSEAQKDATGILVFKGTTTRYEWTQVNAKASLVQCDITNQTDQVADKSVAQTEPCGQAHKGFQQAFLDLLASHVDEAIQPYRQLIITGHSLGGALATVSSLYISTKYPKTKILGVYMFANPRVGDGQFAERFHKNIGKDTDVQRFVTTSGQLWDERDLITLLPPVPSFKQVVDAHGLRCQLSTPDESNKNSTKCSTRDLHRVLLYRDAIQRDLDKLRPFWKKNCLSWD